MAVTVAFRSDVAENPIHLGGDLRLVVGALTLSGTYETGGVALSADAFDVDSVVTVFPTHSSGAGVAAVWDKATSKVILFDEDNASGVAAELANGGTPPTTVPVLIVARKAN